MLTAEIKHIPEETVELIIATAKLEEVIGDYEVLQQKGRQLKGNCPFCGAKKKFDVNLDKEIYKCWTCDIGGKTAHDFLMKKENLSYVEALLRLADRYSINIPIEHPTKTKKQNRKSNFRAMQLKESGISDKDQKFEMRLDDQTVHILDRFQSASIDKRTWEVIPGDDMILHYVGLNGQLMKYTDKKGRERPFMRIRHQFPELNKSKDGRPKRYESPYGSEPKIWFPNFILDLFRSQTIIEKLAIVEGEKKAEALCKEGIPAVAVGGIHSFKQSGEMPYEFQLLIKICGIKKIIWMLDADWQDISIKDPMKPVESRPNLFYLSVKRFKDYFLNYRYQGIDLDVYFGHGIDHAYKGMDDLIVRSIQKKGVLKDDFEAAIQHREGKGEHVNIYKITDTNDYKLKEYWNLHARPKFFEVHKEALQKFRLFKYGKLTYKWNKDANEFELAQKILPHEEFWHEKEKKDGTINFAFNYVGILEFLKNRNFGLYKVDSVTSYFVHSENKVLRQITPAEVKRFVMDFTRDMTHYRKNDILEMLLRGGKQYLGPDKLSEMFYTKPVFNKADKHTMYLYFKNEYWKITKDKIEKHPIANLPRHVWDDKIIDFEPKLNERPIIEAKREKDDWKVQMNEGWQKCEMARFYYNTSCFHWRKEQELEDLDNGNKIWAERKVKEAPNKDDIKILKANFIAKMVAAGYMLHDHIDFGNMKAIIAMDGFESEVGKSNGGTGKGVFCTSFERLVPVHWVNGKRKDLNDDKHIFGGVDERTQIIYFEDVRVNFDFENLFPTITRGTWVEKKGVDGHREDPKKVLIDTNHALRGDGNSSMRRQFLINFSDYYNKHRTVRDDFGHNFYDEWDYDQWNHFYNFMANCMQVYLQFGLKYTIPTKSLERRKLRQHIGESFLDWANLNFHTTLDTEGNKGRLLNHRLEKEWLYNKYKEAATSSEMRYMDTRKFKNKLKKYCEYTGLEWNPIRKDKEDTRIISNGKELFILADKDFLQEKAKTVTNEGDYKLLSKDLPF